MTAQNAAQQREMDDNVVSLANSQSQAVCKEEGVLIHVRFHPNSEVNTIDCCPENISKQDWYCRLRNAAGQNYQALAGGRGFFRIERLAFEAILNHAGL